MITFTLKITDPASYATPRH